MKNWGLYLALLLLKDILSDEYLDHYKYFLVAIYTLCQEKITDDMITMSQKCLNEFVRRYQILYGIKYMTCNIHTLRHLPEMVRRFGPLWTTSCFALEDLNGKMKAMVKGSNSPHLQIISNLKIHMMVYSYKSNLLQDDEETYKFCDSILSPRKKLKLQKLDESISIVGSSSRVITNNQRQILLRHNLQDKNIFVFLNFTKIIFYTVQRKLIRIKRLNLFM